MTFHAVLPRLVQEFFRSHLVSRRDVSPNTLHAYRDSIRLLLLFAAARSRRTVARLVIDDIDRKAVLAFLEHLERHRRNSASTRNARLAAIHSFFRFASEEAPASLDVCRKVLSIPYKRTPSRPVTCLDRDEVEHILGQIDRRSPVGRRDAALLQFLYNTGARAQEVVDLHLPAVRLSSPTQVRILGKGRKERLCPLWPETTSLIRDMLRDRTLNGNEDVPLFLSVMGRALTRFGLRHIVRTRVGHATRSRASLADKRITPHTFRHATALHLLQSGADINVVRNWLGHASVETTHAYVEIDMQMKKAALDACGTLRAGKRRPRWIAPDLLAWLESL
jgi:site-specific recombinase XerD